MGNLVYKTSCDKCGSSDANAVYDDDSTFCFSCSRAGSLNGSSVNKGHQTMRDIALIHGEHKPLTNRRIGLETTKKYNYTYGVDKVGLPCQIANYYSSDKQIVAQKIRYQDKTFKFIGNPKDALMFGQQLWASGGKKLTITEGEIDALAVSEAFNNKYPVVSISSGASSAKREITKHLDWISSFDEIYVWFDNDEPGRKAVEEVCNILPLNKVKVVRHPDLKDACDVLVAHGTPGIVNTFYEAEPYKPDGFVSPIDLIEEALKPIEYGIPWCYDKLTSYSYGRRYGEVVAVGAGVSVGKTDFVMSSVAYDLKQGYNVATFMLEQSKVETLLRIAGKVDGIHYHLPDIKYDQDQLRETITNMPNLHIYDNFGRIDWQTIKTKIRSAVHSYGCRLFYIDNLTALNAHADDERRHLDALMEEIASLAKELGIWILLVSHLNPPKTGASHEAGGRVEQSQFTGSRAIMRWCSFMLGVERNTLHETPSERNKGLIRCIKDRFSGKATGKTVGFIYDNDTGLCLERDEIDMDAFDEDVEEIKF